MPCAPLDLNGTKINLYYTDTGPPIDSTNYTTLIVYHGTMFTGHTFSKLLPLVPSSNVRLVIITRRDYNSHDETNSPGSTPHTESEVEDLKAGHDIALERLGLEVANFLLWFADTQGIPKISDDRKAGGISVMGWSLGSIGSVSLLGHPHAIPRDSRQKLALYFRQLILYNPAEAQFGYFFGRDYGIYPTDLADFPIWASNYYIHPDLTSIAGAAKTAVDSTKLPSFKNMTEKDLTVNFDFNAALRADVPMFTLMHSALEKGTKAAFFDDTLAKEFLPALQIVWISCPSSQFCLEHAKYLMERKFEDHARQKHYVRPVRFTVIEGANHFVHWDEPKKFWDATIDIVQN